VTIETILWDQIFGFDAEVGLGPTNTFHVGFWLNNPEDAAACSFDPTHQTPFNRGAQSTASDDFTARPGNRPRTVVHESGAARNSIRLQSLTRIPGEGSRRRLPFKHSSQDGRENKN